ncbi:MAG: hypothetical protein ACYCZY_02565 [Lacisediminihabitans sp.]
MKKSTKLIVTAAASLLGVALAAGGAYATSGSLALSDAPGQVLQVSGVGPASLHASETAKTHADVNAKGLFGSTPTATPTAEATEVPKVEAKEASSAGAEHAAEHSSTVKGSESDKKPDTPEATTTPEVETVAPSGAVSVDVKVKADKSGD